MKKLKDIDYIWVAIVVAMIVLLFLRCCGCAMVAEPAPQIKEVKPLTVTPHPRFGFDLVIIPAGTEIDGFTTIEPGLYLAGDGLRYIIEKLGLTEQYISRGE